MAQAQSKEIKDSWIKLKQTLSEGYNNFLPNSVVLNPNLHSSSIKVYAVLGMLSMGNKTECYPSYRLLSFLTGYSCKTIYRCIKELETNLLIKVRRTLGEVSIYTLVAKFANNVKNAIKSKVEKAKEAIQDKKNKKNGSNKAFDRNEKPKKDNFNNYSQREYSDEYFQYIEAVHNKWTEPQTTQFNEVYQQALLL